MAVCCISSEGDSFLMYSKSLGKVECTSNSWVGWGSKNRSFTVRSQSGHQYSPGCLMSSSISCEVMWYQFYKEDPKTGRGEGCSDLPRPWGMTAIMTPQVATSRGMAKLLETSFSATVIGGVVLVAEPPIWEDTMADVSFFFFATLNDSAGLFLSDCSSAQSPLPR